MKTGNKCFKKKHRVLFIIHDSYQDDNHFPLGPGYLASILHKKGAFVEAYCMDVFHYTNGELAKHLDDNNYDIIGVGFMAARYVETIKDLCDTVNKHKKNAWFVLGGPCPSAIPEYILSDTNVDVIAVGEAENTIVDLLECKITGGDLSNVDGIVYKKNNKVTRTKKNRTIKNLDEIPLPLWDIFPMHIYTKCCRTYNQQPGEKSLCIVTSRGCTNKCNFCVDENTRVSLEGKERKIKDIKVNDIIRAYDEKTSTIVNTSVRETHQREGDVYSLELDNGTVLDISGEHPIFTKRGWINVEDLSEDDKILCLD